MDLVYISLTVLVVVSCVACAHGFEAPEAIDSLNDHHREKRGRLPARTARHGDMDYRINCVPPGEEPFSDGTVLYWMYNNGAWSRTVTWVVKRSSSEEKCDPLKPFFCGKVSGSELIIKGVAADRLGVFLCQFRRANAMQGYIQVEIKIGNGPAPQPTTTTTTPRPTTTTTTPRPTRPPVKSCRSHPCGRHSQCRDSASGRVCHCNNGYRLSGEDRCDDIDECQSQNNDCHREAECTNSVGSYHCACASGWVGDGRSSCHGQWGSWGAWSGPDVDCGRGRRSRTRSCNAGVGNCNGQDTENEVVEEEPCEVPTTKPPIKTCSSHPCGQHSECRDASDGRVCRCKLGYTHPSGNDEACVDVDECSQGGSGCHKNAKCTNSIGSFHCACMDGWVGDGKTSCHGQWGKWGPWSGPSVDCGRGKRTRTRDCLAGAGNCAGDDTETKEEVTVCAEEEDDEPKPRPLKPRPPTPARRPHKIEEPDENEEVVGEYDEPEPEEEEAFYDDPEPTMKVVKKVHHATTTPEAEEYYEDEEPDAALVKEENKLLAEEEGGGSGGAIAGAVIVIILIAVVVVVIMMRKKKAAEEASAAAAEDGEQQTLLNETDPLFPGAPAPGSRRGSKAIMADVLEDPVPKSKKKKKKAATEDGDALIGAGLLDESTPKPKKKKKRPE